MTQLVRCSPLHRTIALVLILTYLFPVALINSRNHLSQSLMVVKDLIACAQGASITSLSNTMAREDEDHSIMHGQMNDTHYSCFIGNETVTVSTNNPAFVIAGTQKGGTSSLFRLLKQHPQISNGRGTLKIEVHYFDKLVEFQQERQQAIQEKYNISSQDEIDCVYTREYASHFPSNVLAFDKTPSYVYLEHVPELLLRACPWKPKIIVVLRDPVDRAYSHYNFEKTNLYPKRFVDKTFEMLLHQELKLLQEFGLHPFPKDVSNQEWQRRFYAAQANISGFSNYNECFRMRGMYWIQLLKWKELFGDNLLVLNYKELFSDRAATVMQQVHDFIGVPPMKMSAGRVKSNSGSYESEMSNDTRRMLQDFFAPHNEMLASVIGEQWEGIWDYT